MKYTKEDLQDKANRSFSISDMLRLYGKSLGGGSHTYMKSLIVRHNVDISHFTGQGWSRGKVANNRKNPEKILILLEDESHRPKTYQLRRALLETGKLYVCRSCGCGDTWNYKPITLEINHIDGNWLNNIPENLEFLCPNCHSQEIETNKPHKYAQVA